MNRIIKFRGKNTDTKEWVYGYLADETYINNINTIDLSSIEVDSDTVGQYIGLNDKNGQEIYEGDIVRKITKSGYPDNFIGEIVFRDGLFGIKNDDQYGLSVRALVKSSEWVDGNASGTSTYEYEIIGNVYDNPKLLNGGEV